MINTIDSPHNDKKNVFFQKTIGTYKFRDDRRGKENQRNNNGFNEIENIHI